MRGASSAAIGGFLPWVLVAQETLSLEITTSGTLMIDVTILYFVYFTLTRKKMQCILCDDEILAKVSMN